MSEVENVPLSHTLQIIIQFLVYMSEVENDTLL